MNNELMALRPEWERGLTSDDVDVLSRSVVEGACREFSANPLLMSGWKSVPLSTGSKLVSFLPSKPTANWIWGTVQEPKSPMSSTPGITVGEGPGDTVAVAPLPTVTVTASVAVAVGPGAETVTVIAVCRVYEY